jgi:hypothetical protein
VTQGTQAFFSYCREDSEFALKLAGDLKAAGVTVWLDQLDIAPGQRWDRAVEDALENCSRLVVLLSPAAVNSTNVMDEVSFALEERKTIVPVIYRDCTVPFRLRRVQRADFRQDYAHGLQELIRTLIPRPSVGLGNSALSDVQSGGESGIADADKPPRVVEQVRLDDELRRVRRQAQLEEEQKQAAERARVEQDRRRAVEEARLEGEHRNVAHQGRVKAEPEQAAEQGRVDASLKWLVGAVAIVLAVAFLLSLLIPR